MRLYINKKLTIIIAVLLVLTFCLTGCGKGSADEETVGITTASQEQTEETEVLSVYEKIYNKYDGKMQKATEEYTKELSSQADGMDKDTLYDLVKEKTDSLDKIREEGADKMTDQTLESTDDDQEEYEKWFTKLTEKYTEYSRELSEIYTDQF